MKEFQQILQTNNLPVFSLSALVFCSLHIPRIHPHRPALLLFDPPAVEGEEIPMLEVTCNPIGHLHKVKEVMRCKWRENIYLG